MLQSNASVRPRNAASASTREKIRVMLIDDCMILLVEAVEFLRQYSEIELVGSVCSNQDAVAQAELCAPDVVLLDVTAHGADGLGIIAELHAVYSGLPVIVLDMITMESVQRAAHAVGAVNCLTKDTATTSLVPAIRAVCPSHKFDA